MVTAPGNHSSCSTTSSSTMIVKMVPGHDEDTSSSMQDMLGGCIHDSDSRVERLKLRN